MDRIARLDWAKELKRKNYVYPQVDVRVGTMLKTSNDDLKEISIRMETLVEVYSGKGYTVVGDHYVAMVSSLNDLQEFVNSTSCRFRDRVQLTKDNFIANKNSRDFWFTRNEIEKYG